VSLGPDEGDLCGVNGCTGTFQIQPPMDWDWRQACCSCHISAPCGWCRYHELRCTDCSIRPDEIEIAMAEPLTAGVENRLSKLISRTTIDRENDVITGDVGLMAGPLVSLDIQIVSCQSEANILRINPELSFPLNEIFEVPDEFNGHQRGTFYYRNSSGVLRGPFMNAEEAGFHLCRRPFS
jgi:hypothetical protein